MPVASHMQQSPKSSRSAGEGLRIAGIISGCVLALLVIVYLAGCVFFMGRLWPNTTVDGVDFSLKTRAEALDTLSGMSSQLSMRVTGQNIDFTLTSQNAGLELDVQQVADELFSRISPASWPIEISVDHEESDAVATSFDRTLIQTAIEAALAPYNANASDPIDASIAYDPASLSFIVLPGSLGTKLDPAAVTDAVVEALGEERESLTITSEQYVKQSVTADDPSLQQAAQTANSYLSSNFNLTVGGSVAATVNADVVSDWIVISPDLTVTLDDTKLVAWVDQLEAQIDNVGETRTYTRPDGRTFTVSGGTYGWMTDGAAMEQTVRDNVSAGTVGDVEVPLKQSALVYNQDPTAQDWGARYVDVDLTEQHARFYDWDGTLIWETDIISGMDPDNSHTGDRVTPTGVYSLTNKATDQVLVGLPDPTTGEPIYRTPVTYWMPFIGNAVGLHDATWQYNGFGGTLYMTEAGSHGCINLPYDKAEQLFGMIQVGDVVITHY